MPVAAIQGLDRSTLSIEENHALDILVNLPVEKFNNLKESMELDVPGVVGPTTLAKFIQLCKDEGINLSKDGVNDFKHKNGLGNTGAVKGIIGPQTAQVYYDKIMTPDIPNVGGGGQKINQAGLDLVEEFEGYEKKLRDGTDRVMTYIDPVGIPTIGFGHTGPDVTLGRIIDRATAENLLRQDLGKAEAAVSSLVQVQLNSNQFSALVSFVFNVGAGAFKQSTMLKLLNWGKYQEAADQFPRWVMGGGRPLPGLVRRRKAERDLFLT
jgi:GH24 family phage-related lysozyme (muramidase)